MAEKDRIYLSAPHLCGLEDAFIREAFDSNLISSMGPHVGAFEREFCRIVGSPHAVAVSSGTAALHLALLLAGVSTGDEVMVSTLTFCASANPIRYVGATPVFIDSETTSWNMDPGLLEEAMARKLQQGRPPKAVIVVHLYGQSANLDPILALCSRHNVLVIEDAAEAIGATYKNRSPGVFGRMGIFSFNGNKIITTSGGGMLVTDDPALAEHARKLSTQAREPAIHYEHREIGYNYRLSNILAGIGRAQLTVLEKRVQARRANFEVYRKNLQDLPGLSFMPEAPWGRHTRWLTCILIAPRAFGADRETVRQALEADNIEARPLWKPLHCQPVYAACEHFGGAVSEALFRDGLCLPSGSGLTEQELERVTAVIRRCAKTQS